MAHVFQNRRGHWPFRQSGHAQFPPKQIWKFSSSEIRTFPNSTPTDVQIHLFLTSCVPNFHPNRFRNSPVSAILFVQIPSKQTWTFIDDACESYVYMTRPPPGYTDILLILLERTQHLTPLTTRGIALAAPCRYSCDHVRIVTNIYMSMFVTGAQNVNNIFHYIYTRVGGAKIVWCGWCLESLQRDITHVYMHTYIYACMNEYVLICKRCRHASLFIYSYTFICRRYVWFCTRADLYTCMYIYIYIYIHVRTHKCVNMFVYIYIYICIYIYIYIWCERCLLITESPKTPGHYRYLIWVLCYIP